jgi:hypothetical protein
MPKRKRSSTTAPLPLVPPSLPAGAGLLAPVGYLALLLIATDQTVQVVVSVDGFQPAEAVTRFQLMTSVAARTAPLALGFLIALGAAVAAGSDLAVAIVRWGAAIVALGLGLAAAVLWFDGASVKDGVGAEQLSTFTATWLRAQVFSVAGCALFVGLAMVGSRTR